MSTSLLTPRQTEFLALAAQGNSRQEIAVICFVADVTVKKTLEDARGRLGARNTAHAVVIAVALSLIELDAAGCATPARADLAVA